MTDKLSGLISKAMLGIGSLAADRRNEHDGYTYISSDKILEEMGKTLGGLNVAVIPGVTNVLVERYDREQGKVMWCANVSMQMTVKAGEEEITVPWFGAGVDYRVPDKAVYKAITSGHSYFLRKLLMVGVGNEDGEHEVPKGTTKKSPASTPFRTPAGNKDQPTSDNPGEVSVHFKKAKELFNGEQPTVAELFAADPEYCDWVYRNIQDSPVGDAVRAYIDGQYTTQQEVKLNGNPETGEVITETPKLTVAETKAIAMLESDHPEITPKEAFDWAPAYQYVDGLEDVSRKDLMKIVTDKGRGDVRIAMCFMLGYL